MTTTLQRVADIRDLGIREARRLLNLHQNAPEFALSVALRRLHEIHDHLETEGAPACGWCDDLITVPEHGVVDETELFWLTAGVDPRMYCTRDCHDRAAEAYWTNVWGAVA